LEIDSEAIKKLAPLCERVYQVDLNDKDWPDIVESGDRFDVIVAADVLLDTLGNLSRLMNDPNAVYYRDVVQRSNGKIYGGYFLKLRTMERNICQQALFYPISVYKHYSYNLNYRWLADWAYNIVLMGDAIPLLYTGVVVSIFNDIGGHQKVMLNLSATN
jgi:hypothetical protein